jgi:hypothetical protein
MDHDDRVRTAAFWSAIVASVFGVSLFARTTYVILDAALAQELVKDHFAAIVGLSGAALVAFAIVVFLRQTDGPIEFEGLGFKLKGAAGQVVLWVICFFTIALAIKLCW